MKTYEETAGKEFSSLKENSGEIYTSSEYLASRAVRVVSGSENTALYRLEGSRYLRDGSVRKEKESPYILKTENSAGNPVMYALSGEESRFFITVLKEFSSFAEEKKKEEPRISWKKICAEYAGKNSIYRSFLEKHERHLEGRE